MDVQVTSVETAQNEDGETVAKSITVDITPKVQVIATTAGSGDAPVLSGDGKNASVVGGEQAYLVCGTVEISIPLPAGFVDGVTDVLWSATRASLHPGHYPERRRVLRDVQESGRLFRVHDLQDRADPLNPFTDVPADAWYREAVDYAAAKGVMSAWATRSSSRRPSSAAP
jgi:hypothetical protein